MRNEKARDFAVVLRALPQDLLAPRRGASCGCGYPAVALVHRFTAGYTLSSLRDGSGAPVGLWLVRRDQR